MAVCVVGIVGHTNGKLKINLRTEKGLRNCHMNVRSLVALVNKMHEIIGC